MRFAAMIKQLHQDAHTEPLVATGATDCAKFTPA
jgi:hypothetical protein